MHVEYQIRNNLPDTPTFNMFFTTSCILSHWLPGKHCGRILLGGKEGGVVASPGGLPLIIRFSPALSAGNDSTVG